MDERIDCNKCGKKCTPRLWHLKGGFFLRKRIQHLCPYCGSVMYESGGGVGLGVIGLGVLFAIYAASAFNQWANKDEIAAQRLKVEIKELKERVEGDEHEVSILVEKTQGGKNPQLLKQLDGKSEKLEKLKSLLNKKISTLKSANGS
ncbi:hypothetical protein KDW99_13620 [Marinomonas rhizomae]|uniref:hypothetical protein n=1 Tax=Marinomonas rhizomae TaxID=491948 RepID=UPI0021057520|nr:hypothetical protein [Marinomonas rhizomae]UTV98299.1 hypothetical protein KDW99_13620 [Marinomonas rhizomae]